MLVRTSKDKDHPYVMLNKTFLHDPNLSLKAKGLLAYCMSMPDGWEFHINQMITVLKEGRDALNSAFNELIKYGYCIRQQKRQKGKFDSGEYVLYEVPFTEKVIVDNEEKPYTENPVTVFPSPENPPLVINNKSKEENKDIRISFGNFVKFSQEQYDSLIKVHGKPMVDELIQSINDYCVNNRPKGYKDYMAAFRTFVKNYKQESKPKVSNPKTDLVSRFKHGEIYNGAECFINDEGIAFQRGITHLSAKFKEFGFKEQLENILRKLEIRI